MELSSQRRHHRRFEVSDIDGTFQEPLDASVLNMSLAGLAIETTSRLEVGGSYSFRVHKEGQEFQFAGCVMWCEQDGTARDASGRDIDVYHAGVEFGDILTRDAAHLQELIAEHAVLEPGQKVEGKFLSGELEWTSTAVGVGFDVCRLSHTGMIVEARAQVLPGQLVDFQLSPDAFELSGTCRVAYVESCPDEPNALLVRIGLEFLVLFGRGRDRLDNYIDKLIGFESVIRGRNLEA
ncbi:MAG: PilZ domain-containing protein [bacterium]|nr:PilZ domain-containing protein [bacterium]